MASKALSQESRHPIFIISMWWKLKNNHYYNIINQMWFLKQLHLIQNYKLKNQKFFMKGKAIFYLKTYRYKIKKRKIIENWLFKHYIKWMRVALTLQQFHCGWAMDQWSAYSTFILQAGVQIPGKEKRPTHITITIQELSWPQWQYSSFYYLWL